MRPWDYSSELTEERLTKVAQLLERGRSDAVDRHDTSIGGTSWTRGVCAYSYGCHQIKHAAGSPGFEWLSVIDPGLRFQFKVAGVPFRFWRGDPLEPAAKVTAATPMEQLLLDLEPGVPTAGVLFRITLATDEDGALVSASFAAYRGAYPETVWPIPVAGTTSIIVGIDKDRPEGRELPPPSVGDLGDDEAGNEGGAASPNP